MSRCFSGKEKKNAGKWWESRKFEDTFGKLVKEWELTDELFSHLEGFICTLYGYKREDVNKVRWLKFRDKHTKQNKVIDMSALPPCKETLKLHSVQANYVPKIWRSPLQNNINAPSFSGYGWDSEGMIEWVHSPFPNDMDDIFFDPLFDEDDCKFDSECEESDDSC